MNSFNLRMTRFLIVTNPQAVKECVEALKDMDPENAPGTDSFPAEFYKTFGTNKQLV